MFGFWEGPIFESIEFGLDLEELQLCVNQEGEEIDQNFRGFKFLEYGSDQPITLGASCPDEQWQTIDLASKRVVGFTVMVSDHDDRRNIRSICPLIDTIDCRDAEFDLSAVTAQTAVIGGGPV